MLVGCYKYFFLNTRTISSNLRNNCARHRIICRGWQLNSWSLCSLSRSPLSNGFLFKTVMKHKLILLVILS